jgi:hypothetical protein
MVNEPNGQILDPSLCCTRVAEVVVEEAVDCEKDGPVEEDRSSSCAVGEGEQRWHAYRAETLKDRRGGANGCETVMVVKDYLLHCRGLYAMCTHARAVQLQENGRAGEEVGEILVAGIHGREQK